MKQMDKSEHLEIDRKPWFIDFAKIAGRKNLRTYFFGVIKSILCDHCDEEEKEKGIRNAMESLDEARSDESLPWEVMDAKKPSAPTEGQKEISQSDCTIDPAKVEPLVNEAWVEKIMRSEGK